jgi:4-oxalocrotonate tautomerase
MIACLSRGAAAGDYASWQPLPVLPITEEFIMPILRLEMHPGRTEEQKRAFVREVTRVTVETLTCPPESVDVVITEVPRSAWAKAGKLLSDA